MRHPLDQMGNFKQAVYIPVDFYNSTLRKVSSSFAKYSSDHKHEPQFYKSFLADKRFEISNLDLIKDIEEIIKLKGVISSVSEEAR